MTCSTVSWVCDFAVYQYFSISLRTFDKWQMTCHLCQREGNWLKETDVFVTAKQEIRKINSNNKSNTTREQRTSGRVARNDKQLFCSSRREIQFLIAIFSVIFCALTTNYNKSFDVYVVLPFVRYSSSAENLANVYCVYE